MRKPIKMINLFTLLKPKELYNQFNHLLLSIISGCITILIKGRIETTPRV
jgi:ABC-type maltose transport system permease subunit